MANLNATKWPLAINGPNVSKQCDDRVEAVPVIDTPSGRSSIVSHRNFTQKHFQLCWLFRHLEHKLLSSSTTLHSQWAGQCYEMGC